MLLWLCKGIVSLCVWANSGERIETIAGEEIETIATGISILFPQEYQSSPEERLRILLQQSEDLKEIEKEWRSKWGKPKKE